MIDDNPTESSLTKKTLLDKFVEVQIVEVSEHDQLESILSQADFDLVISEYNLRWTTGLKLFRQIRDRYACIPFIILTGSGNEEVAVATIKAGVDDYLSKVNRLHLNNAVMQCLSKVAGKKICHAKENSVLLCEKWDLAISRLTSDFAYSMRISADGKPVFEWFTEPLKKFILNNQPRHKYGLPVHAEDKVIVQCHFDKLLAGFEDTAEYRVVSNNGEIHFFRDHALPIRDWNKGKVVRLYGAIQDVTHQRQAEDRLHLMQHAMDSSNNGIIITDVKDQDYAIIYTNQAFVRMTGYTMDELLGRNPRFLQGDDNKQPGIVDLRAAITNNRNVYTVIRNYRKDGSLFWNEVYVSPVYNKQHKITHYIGVQNDVTRRVEMDQLIWNKEAKMRAIFNNVMDGIIIADNAANIESLNPSAEAMFGYSSKELQGKSVVQIISTDKSQQLKLKVDHLTDHPVEAWGLKKQGVTFPIKTGISKINFEHHALLIFTIQDISECKQAENALRKLSSHLELAREEE
ncbi:MAG: PAS domain S-box protein [Methylococcaceae bacterium]|nr:PAS domain S-box protein [Methylococcaceae bacterium]